MKRTKRLSRKQKKLLAKNKRVVKRKSLEEIRPKGKRSKKEFYERFEDYNKYLASKEWNQIKSIHYGKNKKQCIACKSKKNIQVHHRSYKRLGGLNEVKDLVTVCRTCHKKIHRIEKDKKITVTKATRIVVGEFRKLQPRKPIIKHHKKKKLNKTEILLLRLKTKSDKQLKDILVKELRVKGINGNFMQLNLSMVKNIHSKYLNSN